MIVSSTKPIALIGNTYDPVRGETLQTLVIQNGRIIRVLEGNQPPTDIPGIAVIQLDAGTTIFPGLLNLHTHTTYNILPIWESGQIWTNRFEWRNNSGYKQDINGLLAYIKSNWKDDPDPDFVRSVLAKVKGASTTQAALSQVNTAYAIISEIQAVAGGTTLIQETLDLDSETPDDLGISTSELYSMVTNNPVKALGISGTGSVRVNYDADLFVLRKQNPADDALAALLACKDSDIDFVMVNGRIVFGLTAYFNQLKVDFQPFPATEGAAIAQRGVSINAGIAFNLINSLDIIDTLMQQYCSTVIHQPQMKRTRLMASDDTTYQANINTLQQQLTGLYMS